MNLVEQYMALAESYANKALRWIVTDPDRHADLMEQALTWQRYAEEAMERVVMGDGEL